MALFRTQSNGNGNGQRHHANQYHHGPQQYQSRQQHNPAWGGPAAPGGFPQALKRLQRVCNCGHAHALPVEMALIARTFSDKGTPMAVMACPYRNCNYREGWVIDFRTGMPRKIWHGIHNGR